MSPVQSVAAEGKHGFPHVILELVIRSSYLLI